MSISDLRHCWISLAQKYCSNRTVIYKHFDELIDAYSHKSRYYHDIFHIQSMMEMAITHRSEIEDLDTLQFSVFYHDIVYKALRKDNEIKSAELAQIRIQELGCESSMIDKSYEQIVATQFHQPTEDKDLQEKY